jgi:hypothetical protein
MHQTRFRQDLAKPLVMLSRKILREDDQIRAESGSGMNCLGLKASVTNAVIEIPGREEHVDNPQAPLPISAS